MQHNIQESYMAILALIRLTFNARTLVKLEYRLVASPTPAYQNAVPRSHPQPP
jgi:hypothetical protein